MDAYIHVHACCYVQCCRVILCILELTYVYVQLGPKKLLIGFREIDCQHTHMHVRM